MSGMLELAARVEAATGPSYALECEIHAMLPEPKVIIPPNYTVSIDAALTLVPEGWEYLLMNGNGYDEATLTSHTAQRTAWAASASPALALCAAALRSIASMR